MKIVTSLSFQASAARLSPSTPRCSAGRSPQLPLWDAPPDMPITDEKYKDWLMHCWLEVGDQALMGADMDSGWAANIEKPKNGFDVSLHTHDREQARHWFEQLSEGGRAVMPFAETFLVPGLRLSGRPVRHPWMINTVPSTEWKPQA